MEEAIQEYERLKNKDVQSVIASVNGEIPFWVNVNAADAILYSEHPEESLVIYEDVFRRGGDPRGNTRKAIYHNLVELGRYKEAAEILDSLDKEMSPEVINRGILQDNWDKVLSQNE